MTQVLSNFANTFGAVLVALATWQFALSPPKCCVRVNDTTDCHQVMKETVFSSLDMNFTTSLAMVLAAIGLLVCVLSDCDIITCTSYYSYLLLAMDKPMPFKVYL